MVRAAYGARVAFPTARPRVQGLSKATTWLAAPVPALKRTGSACDAPGGVPRVVAATRPPPASRQVGNVVVGSRRPISVAGLAA